MGKANKALLHLKKKTKKQVKKDSAIVGVVNTLVGTLIYYNNKILQGDILYTI